jgi:hypothetical protein
MCYLGNIQANTIAAALNEQQIAQSAAHLSPSQAAREGAGYLPAALSDTACVRA